ncbi:hypothetical protein SAMN02910384_00103 [Pseudobutyrivibrio sp. ACV-2]|uniref:DUF5717 family protein n=1 Tax=Pseudobutyrivibrio sp. ACV-2 TaxID=1520801 RepID=UPI00089BE57E|nr:DUF5717 family protein [Pseudobutyrivibrio sp. ACV-2]SDZ78899.1 hypothetical protein SAMN02910384_00103 [Pseudobutyrivibrio sp. ACV-2]
MRKRIYRISEDKFDDLKPNIEFEAEQIEETCFINNTFSGSIFFKSTNGVKIRGVVYCDNPYVKIADPLFDSINVRIDYFVDDYNFKPSESLKGHFIIVAVGIEKYIPFSITYQKPPLTCSAGEIHSLQEYADFAQSRFSEAVSLFYTDRFADFISEQDRRTRLLYRGFKAAPIAAVNVDEFLVACGLKTKMTFDLHEREDRYFEVAENVRGEIEICRSTWGFIDISVSCDADFITVEKEHITGDFFLGSIFNMNYYIHKDKMHAGINLARISFDYRDIHKEITIIASADKEGVSIDSDEFFQNRKILAAFRLYEDFRLRRVSTGQWCTQTLEIIDSLEENQKNENFILLLKAFLYVTNNQKQEALWIIQDLKRTIEDKRSREWAFLLYVCTLIEREEDYVDRLTENIEGIFREHRNDPNIFWFLLFLRKEYIKNPTAKLRDIAQWVDEGFDSPLLYIEAYYIFLQDPYLIAGFDEITLKVLNWAKKKDAITKDFAIQMIHVLETEKGFNPKALPILDKCYEIYPDEQFLLAIVSYLLKAPYVDESFLKWYKMAIEANLHVPGIFEAYMEAMPSYSVDKLPQLLTMFFKYNSNLSYDKKALLYANIILHKDEDYDTYEHYESAIETFALEQLRLGRLDDNLAVCYQRLMKLGIFDKEVARLISELSFKRKFAVINSDIRRIFIYQDEFKVPTIANISDHKAYVNYVGSEGVVFLEDNNGYLFVDDEAYLTEEIIHADEYAEKLKELAPLNLTYALMDFSTDKTVDEYTSKDADAAEMLLGSKLISSDFLGNLYPKIIEILRIQNREYVIEKYFMNEADLKSLNADVIATIIEVFIARSKYEEAYYMLRHTNATLLKPAVATKLCQFLINQNPEKPDDFLIIFTAELIKLGISHNDMIRYLIRFYIGPTELMLAIYNLAFEKGEDLVEYSERIITQALYRDIMLPQIVDIFDTYITRRNNKMIVEAFLTYEAHDYLANQTKIPENIFAYIYNRFKKGQNVNESMRIALLKYLCTQPDLDEDDMSMLDMLLADAILRNQYFGFFALCNERLKIKYHLYDKKFIEFNTDKRKSVVIVYSINGAEPVEEDMIEMYDGLYVKQFILFFGDELRYEIYCDELSEEPLKADTFVLSDELEEKQGRYALMNSISRHKMYGEVYELADEVKRYQGLASVTNDLFSIV